MIQSRFAAKFWWAELQPSGDHSDRGALARLRRCATVAEGMQEVAAIQLFRRVAATVAGDLPVVALAAIVLAHVREDVQGLSVARAVGPESPDKPESALLKPLRFRRLLEASEGDERLTAFRRLVALAGGKLPVADLSEALLRWTEDRRRSWIYDYWNAGQPSPPAAPSAKEPAV